MDLKAKKIFLEIYGVLRMTLGIGQIVGLFSGYFLLEWVARYPPRAIYFINEEVVALACLVVLLKGVFHVVAGIGITRFKSWGRSWLLYGWIMMALITYGIVSTLSQNWMDAGMITGPSQVFIWPRIFIYLAVIIFDCTIISSFMKDVDDEWDSLQGVSVRLDGKKISFFLVAGILFFMILLLFGRPIQRGFHQGYYKLKEGAKSSLSPLKNTQGVSAVSSRKEEKPVKPLEILETKRIAIVVETSKEESERVNPVLEPMKKDIKKEIPYRNVFGFLGGFLIVIGFLFKAFNENIANQQADTPMDYIILCLGFVFWIVYGLSIKQFPLALTSGIISLVCVTKVFLKLRQS